MTSTPADRYYISTHEWHKPLPDGLVAVGVSKFAVEELTDITFVDIRIRQGAIKAGQTFGEVESVKATSELYCGIAGEVVAFNQAVLDNPALLNQDPWEQGWLIKVKPTDAGAAAKLMSAQDYEKSRH
jgi:glycine cleavage system H protein